MTEVDFRDRSLFFDFSVLAQGASQGQLRFLIDLIMTRVISG